MHLKAENVVEREGSSHSYEMSDKAITQNISEVLVLRYC